MPRNSSQTDIDPAHLDVASKPRRRRKRAQPEPSAHLKAEKEKALQRALKRPISPGVMLEPAKGGGYQAASPHSDPDLWDLQIADVFGTRSKAVMDTFLRQLSYLAGEAWDDEAGSWKIDEQAFGAALAIVKSIAPKNEIEACLAAEMVAVHFMTMRLSKQALKYGGVVQADAALAGKLARTFVMQAQALQALKGKRRTSKQTIKVSKETHYHVHQHTDREGAETAGQSHERRAGDGYGKFEAVDERPALRRENEVGRVVSLPRRARAK